MNSINTDNTARRVSILFSCILYIFVFTLNTVLCPLSVQAKENTKKIRVGWYSHANIQEGVNPQNLRGYNYEFLAHIALYTNWEYEYVIADWDKCEEMLANGEIDLLGYISKTQERENKYDFSSYPSGYSTLYLISATSTLNFYSDNFSGFDGATVGTISSSFREEELNNLANEKGIHFNTRVYESEEKCLFAMQRGEVNLALISSSCNFSGYRVIYRLHERPFYFAVNKNRPDILLELNDSMRSIYTSNHKFCDELFNKYSSVPTLTNEICFSESESDFINNTAPIKVAIPQDNYPMSYIGTDNKHCGFIYNYLDLISEKYGLEFELLHYNSYFKSIRAVETGEADIILQVPNDFKYCETRNIHLTQSYLSIQRGLLVKNASKITSVAIENGQKTFPIPDESFDSQFLYLENVTQCIDAVENGSADAAMVNIYAYQYATQLYPNSSFSLQVIPNGTMDYAIGVSEKSNPLLCMILDKIVGSIGDAEAQYLLSSTIANPPKQTLAQWLNAYRFVILFILAFIIGLILFLLVFFEQRITSMEKKTNLTLAEKNRELQKANAAKSDFLSRTSHDLRTPMNAIMGLTALALDESSVVEKDFYLSQISTSSSFLLGLINDVLDMDQIENGSITLTPEPYPFSEFSQMLKTMIAPLCYKKNIEFVFEDDNYNEILLVDRIRFNQIFFNLLSNAVKYTPEGGTITFDLSHSQADDGHHDLEVIIADTGIGMTKEFMNHMFEPFSQENRMDDAKGQSSGLGLAIVKGMIDLMGGQIHVESTLHQGTIFLVKLHVPLTDGKNILQKFIDPLELERVLKHKTILLVDDQELNLQVAKKILEKKEIHVTVAKNGEEAVKLFSESDEQFYDAILMDIRMPIMNGLEASKTIRALSRSDALTVPIIAMTANTFEEDKRQSDAAGMNAHLGKPIIPKELFECLYLQFTK